MESPAVIGDLDLRPLARMRRDYFDVMPEIAGRALPGCGKCLELVNDLRRLVEHVVPPAPAGSAVGLDPFRPALYDSTHRPGRRRGGADAAAPPPR